jgi:hypothetical protein
MLRRCTHQLEQFTVQGVNERFRLAIAVGDSKE